MKTFISLCIFAVIICHLTNAASPPDGCHCGPKKKRYDYHPFKGIEENYPFVRHNVCKDKSGKIIGISCVQDSISNMFLQNRENGYDELKKIVVEDFERSLLGKADKYIMRNDNDTKSLCRPRKRNVDANNANGVSTGFPFWPRFNN